MVSCLTVLFTAVVHFCSLSPAVSNYPASVSPAQLSSGATLEEASQEVLALDHQPVSMLEASSRATPVRHTYQIIRRWPDFTRCSPQDTQREGIWSAAWTGDIGLLQRYLTDATSSDLRFEKSEGVRRASSQLRELHLPAYSELSNLFFVANTAIDEYLYAARDSGVHGTHRHRYTAGEGWCESERQGQNGNVVVSSLCNLYFIRN
jgi:hypothetical protein